MHHGITRYLEKAQHQARIEINKFLTKKAQVRPGN